METKKKVTANGNRFITVSCQVSHFSSHCSSGESVRGSQSWTRTPCGSIFPGESETRWFCRELPHSPGPPVVAPNAWDAFLQGNYQHESLQRKQALRPRIPITGLSVSLCKPRSSAIKKCAYDTTFGAQRDRGFGFLLFFSFFFGRGNFQMSS